MKIGVLGNGQLAAMLQEAAPRAGQQIDLYPGPYEVRALADFFSHRPLQIFENEFVDCALLAQAAAGLPVRFLPPLSAIELVQDKLKQKNLLAQLQLPTPAFDVFEGELGSVPAWTSEVLAKLGGQAVFKWARQGYDGKGVCVVTPANKRDPLAFCQEAVTRGLPLYAEAFVPFTQELAMVGVRSVNGDFLPYPLVISEQENGVCVRVRGPATQLGVEARLEQEAAEALRKVGQAAHLVGAFALEFFVDAEQRLWVNEIAPRVHNTGHYSQDACECSQFENHVRACTGQELGAAGCRTPFFAMRNLLGPANVSVAAANAKPRAPSAPGLSLHWYHKDLCKPGRKMGHFNAVARSAQELQERLQDMENAVRDWEALVYKQGQST